MRTPRVTAASPTSLLRRVADLARASGVFGPVSMRDGMVVCHAKDSAAPASYRVFVEGERLWISLVMADRWLSESIETDLLHSGDSVEALIDEELEELGGTPGVKCEHFRSEDLLFTFRTPLSIGPDRWETEAAAREAAVALSAYEACFRRLGDMESAGEDD